MLELLDKYKCVSLKDVSSSEESINNLLIELSVDLSELLDISSRIVNKEKHPNYYNVNEATVVGLLTRIVKLFKESVDYYSANKLEMYLIFYRLIYESFVVMKYLIVNGENSQRNFRLASYSNAYKRYEKLKEVKSQTNPIVKEQLIKIENKIKADGFTFDDLNKKNNKLDGKNFRSINSEVEEDWLYDFTYGVGSSSVHGDWQDVINNHIIKNGEAYYGNLTYRKSNCKALVPLISIVIECITEFFKWIDYKNEKIQTGLSNIDTIAHDAYLVWEDKYGDRIE